ncbi:MAG: chalcone isomerase family protein [Myxococcales bacterium]|nr:chalcone isomerase family protein [Myxococcales bacterium]
MRALLIVAVLGAAFASSASAREVSGVHVPERVSIAGQTLLLNGAALLEASIFKVDVYVAALYRLTKTRDARQVLGCAEPLYLDLRFMRDIGRDRLVGRWREEVEERAGGEVARHEAAINAFFSALPEVREGDHLQFTWLPGSGLRIAYQERQRALLPVDAAFCALFFSGFVGPKCQYESMRTGLVEAR